MASTLDTVKILGRSPLPGGGRSDAGAARNNKVEVWGQITGTYTSLGTAFNPQDIGLSAIDHIDLQTINNSAAAAKGLYTITTDLAEVYHEAGNEIVLQTIANVGTVADAAATSFVVNFRAFGDDARAPALT